MAKTFLILGGYGNTGRPITDLLLQYTDVNIVLAGRNLSRAETCAAEFNTQYSTDRVSAAMADASDAASLNTAFEGVDFVIAASSTSDYVATVAQAAIDAKTGYLDVQVSNEKVNTLQAMHEAIKDAGCIFITDGGFHPGLPAAMVRWAAPHFDVLETANVGSLIRIDWNALEFSPATVQEMAGEFVDYDTTAFVDGAWRKLKNSEMKHFDFGPPYGKEANFPMPLGEMTALPDEFPTLRNTGFFVGGFNAITNWVIFPMMMGLVKLSPRLLPQAGQLLQFGLKRFSRPPYRTILLLDAHGQRGGDPYSAQLTLSHEDGYFITAAPVVATLLQVLDGTIHAPGLYFQGNVVEPERLITDIERMGIKVESTFI